VCPTQKHTDDGTSEVPQKTQGAPAIRPKNGIYNHIKSVKFAFSALTLLVGRQEEHPAGGNCDGVLV